MLSAYLVNECIIRMEEDVLKFTIIIPAYNAEKTIKDCIESVKSQDYPNIQLLVVNDGSTDDTYKILNQHLSESNIINKHNGGVSSARNAGLQCAEGDYIIFLDADDTMPTNAISTYVEIIKREGKPDIIFGAFLKVYPKRKMICNLIGDYNLTNGYTSEFDVFSPRLLGTVWGKCYKRELLAGEEFDSELSLCEDAEYNYRVLKRATRFFYTTVPVYAYTYSHTSTIRRYSDTHLENYVKAIEKIYSENIGTMYEMSVIQFGCNVFNVICFNVVFTLLNNASYIEKRKVLSYVRTKTVFKTIIDNVDMSSLPMKHRIPLVLARYNQYFLIYIMSFVNRIINKLLY